MEENNKTYNRQETRKKLTRRNTGDFLMEGTEMGWNNELNDVFAYHDRKKQNKLPMTQLEEVVSCLGIALPATDKREPIKKTADPTGSIPFTMRIRFFYQKIIGRSGETAQRKQYGYRRHSDCLQAV